jgi:hypothetical protein
MNVWMLSFRLIIIILSFLSLNKLFKGLVLGTSQAFEMDIHGRVHEKHGENRPVDIHTHGDTLSPSVLRVVF